MSNLNFLYNFFICVNRFFDMNRSIYPVVLVIPFAIALFYMGFKILKELI